MRMIEFQQIPENPKNIIKGEKFFGEELIKQKSIKNEGDEVTYYVIIEIKDGNRYEYMPVYDTIEK